MALAANSITPKTNAIAKFRQSRRDVWHNRFTAYGSKRDHGQQFRWRQQGRRLDWQALSDMYSSHEIIWKIVNLLPDNALRKWLVFPDLTVKQQRKLKNLIKNTEFKVKLKEGLHEARLHGGCLLYAPLMDGNADDEPLDEENITDIGKFRIFSNYYVHHVNVVDGQEQAMGLSMDFTHYRITGEKVLIHKSRAIRLPGAEADTLWKLQNNGWDQSFVERSMDPIVGYAAAHGMIPNILKDIVRDVIKMEGLNELSITTNPEDQIKFDNRMDTMMQGESLLNKTVIDNLDDLIRQTTQTSGIPEMVKVAERRLCAATGIPNTKLLGESAGPSLGESGKSQKNDWDEATEDYQADVLTDIFDQFFSWAEPVTKIDEIAYLFAPLNMPTVKERAEIFERVAKAIAILLKARIITQLEASTAFEGGEVNPNVRLNLKARMGFQDREIALLEAMLKEPDPMDDFSDDDDMIDDENSNLNGDTDHGKEQSGTKRIAGPGRKSRARPAESRVSELPLPRARSQKRKAGAGVGV